MKPQTFAEKIFKAQRKRRRFDYKENPRTKSTCTIITEHHKTMKEDPEHLSTDFIQKLIGKDCAGRTPIQH
jgi:hypothetical protein